MLKRKIGLALLLAVSCVGMSAQAGNTRAAREQIESSLLVKGTITIARDGSVLAHSLDSTESLGAELTKFVDASIDRWHFQPVSVDGQVVIAKMPMSLRLIAQAAEGGNLNVKIASTHFGGGEDVSASERVESHGKLSPPNYPQNALQQGGKGTVYLIAQIGRDGAVMNVDAEQVNLGVIGTEARMAAMRDQFAAAAIRAAKRWTFKPPTTGVLATQESWLVRIPVKFALGTEASNRNKATKWESYVPGPRNKNMSWAREQLMTAGSPEALSEGGIYPLQQGAKLLPSPTT